LSALLGMMGAGGLSGGQPGVPPGVTPEQHYAAQLSALVDMGFTDTAANLRALQATGGNVHAAVDRLLSGLP
jgi:ubiquilin